MSTDIPLKIRVGIRDQWDSPNAPIRNSIGSLTKTLGHNIAPQVEWPSLYNSLKETFSEPTTFVPAICRIGLAFYGRMLSRVENEANLEWIDKLLVSDETNLQRPRLTWKIGAGVFRIEVPNRKPSGNAVIEAGFDEDLDKLFGSSFLSAIPEEPSELYKEDDWAELTEVEETPAEIPQQIPSPDIQTLQRKASRTAEHKRDDLPTIDMLHRPAKLFRKLGPSFLTVNASTCPLLVQGSNQASLEHLASYLRKWAKINQNDSLKRPILKVETVESAFFSDVIDTVSIEPTYSRGLPEALNPTTILAFIEGILGYKEVYTNGTRWVFKLDLESNSETAHGKRF
ncbi:hypothetical protein BDZ97DRAFT_2076320 [Flammula alnicola]|nr:hypothetical protein BDZ97DRAFT_2076320 [Flammula alnicola]